MNALARLIWATLVSLTVVCLNAGEGFPNVALYTQRACRTRIGEPLPRTSAIYKAPLLTERCRCG